MSDEKARKSTEEKKTPEEKVEPTEATAQKGKEERTGQAPSRSGAASEPERSSENEGKAPERPHGSEETEPKEAAESAPAAEDDSGQGRAPGKRADKKDRGSPDKDVLIRVRDLTKRYGDVVAVNDISFEIRRGEIVGLLGPNGAGKTTTMRILTCLQSPTEGRAWVAGHDTLTESMEVRRAIGYLPEDTPLYTSMSVLEFLRFIAEMRDVPKDQRADKIRRAVKICGLEGVLGRTIGHLSKGYRQRVGLAQAILHDPPILILDEPWTGLDPNQIADVRNLIKELGKDKTVLVSTHILAEVEAVCTRVMIIDQGRILADGTPEAVVAKHGAVRYEVAFKADGESPEAFEEKVRSKTSLPARTEVADLGVQARDGRIVLVVSCRKGRDLGQEALLETLGEFRDRIVGLDRRAPTLEEVFRAMTVGDRVEIGKAA